jgi:hypothetical protein
MQEFDKTGRYSFGHMKGGCCCHCGCCGQGSEGCGCEGHHEWHEPTSKEKLEQIKGYKQALKEKLEYLEKLEKELETVKED